MKINPMHVFLFAAILYLGVSTNVSTAFAAEGKAGLAQEAAEKSTKAKSGEITSPAETEEEKPDPLDEDYKAIKDQLEVVNSLKSRVEKGKGVSKRALDLRLSKARKLLIEKSIAFVEAVIAEKEDPSRFEKHRQQALEVLELQSETANAAIHRLRAQIQLPESGQSAAEQAAAYSRLFDLLNSMNQFYELFIKGLDLSKNFDVDVSKQERVLKDTLADRAANGSVLLEIAMNDVTALNTAVAAVPDDAELKAKLTVATNHVASLAEGLKSVLGIMESLGMDTTEYQEQVLTATGQITTDVFEVSVFTNLLLGWGQTLWNKIIEDGPNLVFKVLLFLIIVLGFNKLAGFVQKLIEQALEKSQLKLSELLRRMVVSIVKNVIVLLGILIALSQIGISLGPLLAGLGVVGFVVGFALQDSLSNFAAGMLILIYRPFDVGDLIEAGGISGKVSHMSLVNTTILTLDNQTIVVPNNKIWGDVVKNVTAQTMRRVDMVFGISYTDDIPKTEKVLQDIVDSHEKVLADPEPIVRLHELADSSVNFIVRPWVNMDDYWDVYWDITRAVKMRFDAEGISIPFPQRDVHLYSQST